MGARRQLTVMVGLVAALIVLLLAGLLVLDRSRVRWGASGVVPPPIRETDLRRAPHPPRTPPGEKESPPPAAEGEGEEAALPSGRAVPGRAVSEEDRLPVAGVSFLDGERLPDGTVQPFLDRGSDDDPESGADGRFTLRWERAQEEILLFVVDPSSTVVSIEGGEIVETMESSTVVRALPETGPLVLVLGTRTGYAFVRPVDAEDGAVLSGREGVAVRWTETFENIPPRRWTGLKKADAAGWIPALPPSVRNLRGPALGEPLTAVLEVLLDGYEVERIPRERVRGRLVVPLRRAAPSFVGVIRVPDGGEAGEVPVHAGVRPRDPGVPGLPPDPRGLPSEPGAFAVYDLPHGSWVLEVVSPTPKGNRWARRAFDFRGATVDLGEIVAADHAGLRVRVLDSTGRVLSGVPLSLTRAEESGFPVEGVRILDGRATAGGAVILRAGTVEVLHTPGTGDGTAEGGWHEFRGLLPGARYGVAARNIPGLKTEVTAPEQSGRSLDVELRWEKRMVHCTLRFTLDGSPFSDRGAVVEAPFLLDDWGGTGLVTTDLPPGRHTIRVRAVDREGRTSRIVSGVIEVPDAETHDGTVDLK